LSSRGPLKPFRWSSQRGVPRKAKILVAPLHLVPNPTWHFA
jgi:hypothetical protein